MRVVTNVRMSFIQALAAQQTLELRQSLSKLAHDAVQTSRQLANVGQADAPDVLEAEVEAQQAELAVTMAEQNQQRIWKALSAVVGNPRLPLMRLEGKLEDTPPVNADELVEKIVNESPAVRIAELGVKRAEATLARARRESIPDLQIRAGMQQNGELLSEPNGKPVGLQGFADVGVRIPIFNRNQGNIVTAKADLERAEREVERVKLVLRERAASVVRNYAFSQTAVDLYKNQMIPRAQKAYEMYAKKYREMASAYPQVLIAQRTLMQLEVSYITALEIFATSSVSCSPTCSRTVSKLLRSQAESINQCGRSTFHFRWAQARRKGERMRKRTLLLSITAACIAAAAAFGWVTIRRGFSARDSPSAMETLVATTARQMAVPSQYRQLRNPRSSSSDVHAGMEHFADHCAAHTRDARKS